MALRGDLTFPGDKSLSHRALMLAALAHGDSTISNLSAGADVRSTRRCLEACGVEIRTAGKTVQVQGGTLTTPSHPLDCGNSGTTVRLLAGLLAGQGITATFTGDDSLSRRPMQRIITPLEKMGVTCHSNSGHLPLTIEPGPLHGIDYTLPVASAQVKSSLLLAALGAEGATTVREPYTSRDHTERLLTYFGLPIQREGLTIRLRGGTHRWPPFDFAIPGDPSTAAYFAAAAAIIPDSCLTLKNISLNPTRTGFFSALETMGGNLSYEKVNKRLGEPAGDLEVTSASLRGYSPRREEIPALIDEIPILAVLATQAEGETRITGASELRVKECDRIHAVVFNLKQMGADIREQDDGFIINGPTLLRGASIRTFHDHRIAMAFTVAGLISDGPTVLDDPACVQISSPEFFSFLEKIKQ
ncbi:MAG: 3-phosphoshikimate 1-carboxyvinyltransferase [Fidelibacterota bacterium]